MIFFTDENIAEPASDLLRVFDRGNEIRKFLEHFPRGTPDVDWLTEIKAWSPKPFIVCADGRILKNAVERAALKSSGCTFIYLASGWTNIAWDTYAWKVIRYWPEVRACAQKTEAPAIIELSTSGHVQRRPL